MGQLLPLLEVNHDDLSLLLCMFVWIISVKQIKCCRLNDPSGASNTNTPFFFYSICVSLFHHAL